MAHTEIPKLSDFVKNRRDTKGHKRFADALDRWNNVHERERLTKAKNFDKPPKKGPPRPKEGYVGPVYNPDTWMSKEPLTEKRTVGSGRSKKDVTFYRVPGTSKWGGPNSYERTRQRSALFNALPPSIRDFNPNDNKDIQSIAKPLPPTEKDKNLHNIKANQTKANLNKVSEGTVEGGNKNKF